MKLLRLCVIVASALAMVAAMGCEESGEPNDPPAPPPVSALIDTPFDLEIGQSAVLAADGFRIRFVGVVEDSRCPTNVQCVTAGRARVAISLHEGDRILGEHELTLDGGSTSGRDIAVERYIVRLDALEPYPGSGSGETRATFVVSAVATAIAPGPTRDVGWSSSRTPRI